MNKIILPPHLHLLANKINENINSKEIKEILEYTIEEIESAKSFTRSASGNCENIFNKRK